MRQQDDAPTSPLVYDTVFQWRYLKPVYWPSWLAALLLWSLMLLPAAVTDGLGSLLGDLARNMNRKRRRIARKNLQLSFPELSEQQHKDLLCQTFRAQMRSVLHYGLFWWAPRRLLEKRIIIKGVEHIEASRRAGKNIIIMTSHSVGLEAAVSAITMRYPVSGPFKVMRNPVINWLVARGRSRFDALIYTREAGLRPIIRDARAGRVLFYLPDEDLGPKRSIFVPLFGVPKATIPVLGRLAKNCKADVLPCISCYDATQRKYVVHVLSALKDFPQGDDVIDATTMNRAIEQTIALCPAEYFWSLRIYRTRPEGEQRFY
jgi:lauroyl-KDO2-lipid IV(A) myristoyltransferase